jgi:nicotinamide mononucleotide (NMN) deamidase PncC
MEWPSDLKYRQISNLFEYDTILMTDNQKKSEVLARKAAYALLNTKDFKKYSYKVTTAESLTAGLIFSTLVDVPAGGWQKWGCFGVYDTAAKEKYIGVQVRNEKFEHSTDSEHHVYSGRCAAQMAVGALLASQKDDNFATLAIAVTGQAMPHNNLKNTLGHVWIGIASYTNDTFGRSKNMTNDSPIKVKVFAIDALQFSPNLSKLWRSRIDSEQELLEKCNVDTKNPSFSWIDGFNDPLLTATVSKTARWTTVFAALTLAKLFVEESSNNHYKKCEDLFTKKPCENQIFICTKDCQNLINTDMSLNYQRAKVIDLNDLEKKIYK